MKKPKKIKKLKFLDPYAPRTYGLNCPQCGNSAHKKGLH